jgi:hypothetical protein
MKARCHEVVSTRPRPRALTWGVALAAILLGACLPAACGGNHSVPRGYDSRQLLPIRSNSVALDGSNGPGVATFATKDSAGNVSYWSLDLTSGETEDWGSTFPTPSGSPNPPPAAPYRCSIVVEADASAGQSLGIGPGTGLEVTTEIPNVVSYAQCPGADQKLTAFVQDPSGDDLLMTGPFTDLQPVPLPIDVTQVAWWTYDQANAPATVAVWGTPPGTPGQVGFYSVDLTSDAVTTEIPPVPASAAWAPGATPSGSLQSTSLDTTMSIYPFGPPTEAYFLYPRAMSDGGTTIFAGPFASDTAGELALFRVPDGLPVPVPVTTAMTLGGYYQSTLADWQISGAGTSPELVIWNDATRRVTICPSAGNVYLAGQVSPDGSKILFVTPQSSYQYGAPGPLILLTPASDPGGTDACTTIAGENVIAAGFSPDSTFMYWVVQPPAGEQQLWVAASDGSGARLVGTGVLQNLHFIASGGAELEMILGGDLVWMDLHDGGVNLHYVAQQVFDLIFDLRDGWLIAGYDYSSQDTNGTLGLVNRNTGDKRAISPQIQQFIVLAEALSADGGFVSRDSDAAVSSVLTVVYLVHGRNPSAQDGIWTATITAADLQ